ncbi:MAG: GNAT family N-acetyltransferase [Eubacteriales bacterium]|nr:GNAT family N-acetyltransferase [Eubacteriales bacterium]
MDNVIIRSMKEEDSLEVLEMMKVFYASPALISDPSEDVMRRDIADCLGDNPYIECFVFEDNEGVIMGYSMVAHSYSTECGGNCVWVEDIYIKPDYRGKSIAGEFFDYLDKLYGREAVRFRLEVEEENERAVKAYKKAGFEKLGYVQMAKDY